MNEFDVLLLHLTRRSKRGGFRPGAGRRGPSPRNVIYSISLSPKTRASFRYLQNNKRCDVKGELNALAERLARENLTDRQLEELGYDVNEKGRA